MKSELRIFWRNVAIGVLPFCLFAGLSYFIYRDGIHSDGVGQLAIFIGSLLIIPVWAVLSLPSFLIHYIIVKKRSKRTENKEPQATERPSELEPYQLSSKSVDAKADNAAATILLGGFLWVATFPSVLLARVFPIDNKPVQFVVYLILVNTLMFSGRYLIQLGSEKSARNK